VDHRDGSGGRRRRGASGEVADVVAELAGPLPELSRVGKEALGVLAQDGAGPEEEVGPLNEIERELVHRHAGIV
jgi:hypothetical protein